MGVQGWRCLRGQGQCEAPEPPGYRAWGPAAEGKAVPLPPRPQGSSWSDGEDGWGGPSERGWGMGRLCQIYGSPTLGFHRESRGAGLGRTPWVHMGRSGRPADSQQGRQLTRGHHSRRKAGSRVTAMLSPVNEEAVESQPLMRYLRPQGVPAQPWPPCRAPQSMWWPQACQQQEGRSLPLYRLILEFCLRTKVLEEQERVLSEGHGHRTDRRQRQDDYWALNSRTKLLPSSPHSALQVCTDFNPPTSLLAQNNGKKIISSCLSSGEQTTQSCAPGDDFCLVALKAKINSKVILSI